MVNIDCLLIGYLENYSLFIPQKKDFWLIAIMKCDLVCL